MKRLVAGVAIVAVWASAAAGHIQQRDDPDETPGPLDIKRVAMGHTNNLLVHGVRMQHGFRKSVINKSTPNRIFAAWDTRAGRRLDYVARIFAVEGRLKGTVHLYRTGRRVGRLRDVTKPKRNTVIFEVARGLIRARGDGFVRWGIVTDHVQGRDAAGLFRHPL